ncbi:MAG: 50S ribosomal protein L6 [Gammaproteobacteria bacterium]
MSRVAKNPIPLPSGVAAEIDAESVVIKGKRGTMSRSLSPLVGVTLGDGALTIAPRSESKAANMMAGTYRALLANMVLGVSSGFKKKLEINGVGYRAQVQGKTLNLTLGYSHPIKLEIPEGITIKTPSVTEVLVEGNDKQQVGQIAANIRAFRPPEPYKGKGIKYSDEVIVRKEAKKA